MEEHHPNPGHIDPIEHQVPHVSTLPGNAGELVHLFVREYDGSRPHSRKCVLMIHGRSIPALTTFDLGNDRYSWALSLAKAGFDVFILDFQGSGQSPRPKMDQPCNVDQEQQLDILMGNPLSRVCPADYPYQLSNSQSEWDQLDQVVEYIKTNRNVDKVALIGVSAAAFAIGPYAIKYPNKVESVLLNAPIFPPRGRPRPGTLPVPGFPMNLTTKENLEDLWKREINCINDQRDEGIMEIVWKSIMDNDRIGRTWGPKEGVLRGRTANWWGWDAATVTQTLGDTVPVFIIYGEHDVQATTAPLSVEALYQAISGPHKLMFKVACTGHYMIWERRAKFLHQFSEHWLKHGKVKGKSSGSYLIDKEGNLSPETVSHT